MTNFALFCAILLSAFSCTPLPADAGVKEAIAIRSEEGMLVAVIPEVSASYAEKGDALASYAERLSGRRGIPVLLTEDLRTYMALKRMALRGVSSYEKERLLSRGESIARYAVVA